MASVLAFALALSAFAAPLAAVAAPHAGEHVSAEAEPAGSQEASGHLTCHKIAACEVPAVLLRWHRAAFSGRPSRLSFLSRRTAAARSAPEVHVPPPKL